MLFQEAFAKGRRESPQAIAFYSGDVSLPSFRCSVKKYPLWVHLDGVLTMALRLGQELWEPIQELSRLILWHLGLCQPALLFLAATLGSSASLLDTLNWIPLLRSSISTISTVILSIFNAISNFITNALYFLCVVPDQICSCQRAVALALSSAWNVLASALGIIASFLLFNFQLLCSLLRELLPDHPI